MRAFAHKPEPTRKTGPNTPADTGWASPVGNPEARSGLLSRRAIGNQAERRVPRARTDDRGANLASDQSPVVGHDFSRIPVRASVQRSIQPKPKVGAPGDRYEQEADQVAARVVRQGGHDVGGHGGAERQAGPVWLPLEGESANQTNNRIGAEPETNIAKSAIEPGSSLGKPLDAGTREEMGRKLGFDFGNVRIHTDAPAVYLNKGLNARAATHGSDIFFNEGEYDPSSSGGRELLAHELTHVVQQAGMPDGRAPRGMIQRTSVGQVLDEFFSPFSDETLWVMDSSDNYTRIVRTWRPVIDAVNRAKANLEANCANWQANHMTDPSWRPGMTDPPVTDPNAHGIWVASPPGTDPDTCKNAFIIYVTSSLISPLAGVQTFELYTCSIGSFGIYATADSIDCAAKTARINIWMYNAMDQGSFGKYASHPAFALSGMERQYMWWNWTEPHSWGPPAPTGGAPGGPGGGSSRW